jgi:uncharacterized protein
MLFILFVLGFVLLFEIYFYQGVSTLIQGLTKKKQKTIRYIYWGYTLLVVFFMLGAVVIPPIDVPRPVRVYGATIIIIITVSKAFATFVLIFDDILRIFRWIGRKILMLKENPSLGALTTGNKISRLKFLSLAAMIVAAIPFLHMIFGLIWGAHRYTIHRNRIKASWLPPSFNGLKIIQISDIHCGSFLSTQPLKKAIAMINEQKPDLVFVTGDLVNDHSGETDPFVNVLNKIEAKMGVYSCMGNHDYGDYLPWESPEEKKANIEKLKYRQKEVFGWNLLMNENRIIEKNGEQIAIIGVENYGRTDRYPRYGDMEKSLEGVEHVPCKLLLSHDPYHFQKEVSVKYPQINFTFSGHTHGMQFGVEIPGIKWSPVQYVYEHWAGLLKKGSQYLYINRGLGYIGYAGRAGIWPEITVHEFYHEG